MYRMYVFHLYNSRHLVNHGATMTTAYLLRPVDFNFAFSSANLSAGESVVTGQSSYYTWRADGQTGSTAWSLDNESVAEIAGIEIFGPYNGNYREKIKYVRPVIDGREMATISFNELMAPGLSDYVPDPLGAAGMRWPNSNACMNLGIPVLMGGDPMDACPKIGPNDKLSIKVAAPRTAEGGIATIDTDMKVRVWIAQAKGQSKVNELLTRYGRLSGGRINSDIELGDLEISETMNIRSRATGNPISKSVPRDQEFKLTNWTQLPGGDECDKPKVENFVVYGQNARPPPPTSGISSLRMVAASMMIGRSFGGPISVKRTPSRSPTSAFSLIHDLKYLRITRSNRAIDNVYEIQPANNPFPLPAGRYTDALQFYGPGKLAKSIVGWNEIMSIEVKDNGTSVPAWSATNRRRHGRYLGQEV